jgi:hypothetical protein
MSACPSQAAGIEECLIEGTATRALVQGTKNPFNKWKTILSRMVAIFIILRGTSQHPICLE